VLREKSDAEGTVIFGRIFKGGGSPPSQDEVLEYLERSNVAYLGEEGAEAMARFESDVLSRFIDIWVREYEAMHPLPDDRARDTLTNMFMLAATHGYHTAAQEAYDRQLVATAAAADKLRRKADETHRLIAQTFSSMNEGTKTERVRRTAAALGLSESRVWEAVREID
jgi:hypothetical protein